MSSVLFQGLIFRADSDVDDYVLSCIEEGGGTILFPFLASSSPPDFWLINQLGEDEQDPPRKGKVIFQNWINMCVIQKKQVDPVPFTVSGQMPPPPRAKKLKA